MGPQTWNIWTELRIDGGQPRLIRANPRLIGGKKRVFPGRRREKVTREAVFSSDLEPVKFGEQFTGLADLISANPAGPAGPQGDAGAQGPPFAAAVVDGVTTLLPLAGATVISDLGMLI